MYLLSCAFIFSQHIDNSLNKFNSFKQQITRRVLYKCYCDHHMENSSNFGLKIKLCLKIYKNILRSSVIQILIGAPAGVIGALGFDPQYIFQNK